MIEVATTKLRDNLARVIRKVHRGGEHVIVKRRGKGVVAIVPIGDWELLRALEDKINGADARRVRNDGEAPIPLAQAKAELGA